MQTSRGTSLLEALLVVGLVGILLSLSLPVTRSARANARTAAGARELAVRMQALRWSSVARGRSHGLWFRRDALGWHWFEVRDGNGNGLSTAELMDGTDRTLAGPRRIEELVEHVHLGFPPGGPFPRVPPRRGTVAAASGPVRFGSSTLVSFSPLGASSSGTLYLSDGRLSLFAVVLYGRTGRLRVWRWDAGSGAWRL